jgi:Domain of unknown function (DUF5615)
MCGDDTMNSTAHNSKNFDSRIVRDKAICGAAMAFAAASGRRGFARSPWSASSMKIKLHENLPHRLAPALEKIGHDVHTLLHESLVGHRDEKIWAAAQQGSRFLITQDLDFSDARKFSPGSHGGYFCFACAIQAGRTSALVSSSYSAKRPPTTGWVASWLLQNARFGF